MARVRSFPPIALPDARVLILGSMPGAASLSAGQYYAHPRNLFWPIMGALVGAAPELPYPHRIARLAEAGIAVWDVLASCVRPGSLDSSIAEAQANDFAAFFARHRRIGHVFFNGSMAQTSFRRLVRPTLPATLSLHCARLPSTSPAHAGLSREAKLAAWRAVLEALR